MFLKMHIIYLFQSLENLAAKIMMNSHRNESYINIYICNSSFSLERLEARQNSKAEMF